MGRLYGKLVMPATATARPPKNASHLNPARQKNGDIAGTACCSLPILLSWRSIGLNDSTHRTSRHPRSHL
jgi:hypothetical protein